MEKAQQVRPEDSFREVGSDPQYEYVAKAGIRWWLVGLSFVICILTLLVLNYPALKSPMMYDTGGILLAKSDLFQRNNMWDVIRITSIRPLLMVTLYLNYATTGMDPQYFRVVNIVLAAGSGIALSLLIFLVLEIGIPDNRCTSLQRLTVSLFLGFVFAVHPLQTLATLYIWQRGAILACLFYFSAVAVYLATRSGHYRIPTLGHVLTGSLFFAGMLCKENVVTVPAVLFLAEATLFRQNLKELGRSILRIGAIVLVPLILYLPATNNLAGSETTELRGIIQRLAGYYEYAGISLTEMLLTESRVFLAYLATILLPIPGTIDQIKAMTISRSLISPPVTVAACAGVAGLIGLGIYLIRKWPIAAFGILFFVISLIPESTLVPPYLFFGYRAILPMAGVLMILGEATLWVLAKEPGGSRVGASNIILGVFSGLTLAGLLTATYVQATAWNPLTFWRDAYEKLPLERSLIEKQPYLDIVSNLTGLMVRGGDVTAAERLCREALELYPDARHIHDNLGVALLHQGRIHEAIGEFRKAVALQPNSAEALNNLGNALLAANQIPEAVRSYMGAIKLKPTRVQPYVNLGAAYANSGQYENARKVFQEAVRVDPNHAKARANLGITLVNLGLFSEAIEHLNKAVQLDPTLAIAHLQLGIARDHSGDTAQAVRSYERALRLIPTLLDARVRLAESLIKLQRYPESIHQYQRILQADPKNYKVHNDLASVFIITSQYDKAIKHCQQALSLKPDFSEARANLSLAFERSRTKPAKNP